MCIPSTYSNDSAHKRGIIVAAGGNMHNFPMNLRIEIADRENP
jgi:hypothetical protein